MIAALTGSEPVAVVGRGTGIDDDGWARKASAIRDALYRACGEIADPLALLRVCGGADLAAMAGFLAQAAVRRAPRCCWTGGGHPPPPWSPTNWPRARGPGGGPGTGPPNRRTLALQHLELEPILDLGMRLGEGSGAAVALPVLRAAGPPWPSMATFVGEGRQYPTAPRHLTH